MIPRFMILACISMLLMACSFDSNTENDNTDTITFSQLLDNYYEEGLILDPLSATSNGDNRYNHIFPNYLSDEHRMAQKEYHTKYLSQLSRYSDSDLTESERMSKAVLQWNCEIKLEGLSFRKDLLPIDQMWSLNLFVGQLAGGNSIQPFNTVEDYQNWLKRLDGYLEWMKTAESRMKEGIEMGYVLPTSLIVKVIPQIKAFTIEDLDQHLFFAPIKQFPASFSSDDREMLSAAYTNMVSQKIIPAYERLYQFISTEYLAAGRATSGIASIPNGEAYYQYQIKTHTTTDLTSEEIHQLGLNEVSRILREMEQVKTDAGYSGDLRSFARYVENKKELLPYTTPEQVIDHFNSIHERMKPQLARLFDYVPKTAFEVRRTEKFRENSASAEYHPGSLDGSRAGVFYVPIPDASRFNIFSTEDLFLHEAIPGHHYQISFTQENEDLPRFRKVAWSSAYGEGWALYTESLGKELGLYTDPYQYYGMLRDEIARAVRLVVDTGLHSKGWSREEAIQYSLAVGGEYAGSIERFMANPGQALSYKIGQLKILELRNRAEMELGNRFDIRQFHNQVLETGCIPLALLEDKIDNWIANY